MPTPRASTPIQVAKAIAGLSYIDMTEIASMLISSIESDKEEGITFDASNHTAWCELLRWWAVGYIEAQGDN